VPTASPARPRLITIVHMPIIALTVLSARLGLGDRLPTKREMTPSRGDRDMKDFTAQWCSRSLETESGGPLGSTSSALGSLLHYLVR
jgi:hypothetical protein